MEAILPLAFTHPTICYCEKLEENSRKVLLFALKNAGSRPLNVFYHTVIVYFFFIMLLKCYTKTAVKCAVVPQTYLDVNDLVDVVLLHRVHCEMRTKSQ